MLLLGRRLETIGGFTGEQRVRRAWEFGQGDQVAAAQSREGGEGRQLAGDAIPGLRNSFRAIVVDKRRTGPCWTRSAATFRERCFDGRTLVSFTVTRSFASQSELESYFLGSALELPVEV